jgi:hypothetical protein
VVLTLVLLLAAYIAGRVGGIIDQKDVRVGAIEAPCDAACQAIIGDRRATHQDGDSPFSPAQVKDLETSFGPERVKELSRALIVGPKYGGPLNVRRLVLKCYYWVPLQALWDRVPTRVYWVGSWSGYIDTPGAKAEEQKEWWGRLAYDAETGEMFSMVKDRDSLDCPTSSW